MNSDISSTQQNPKEHDVTPQQQNDDHDVVDKKKCIFCKIIAGESPQSKILFENDKIVIIEDIKPASRHHYLAIPKQHIINTKHLNSTHLPLVLEMEKELKNLMITNCVTTELSSFGFHWPPFTSVPHLHMHAIGPTNQMKLLAQWIFKPNNIWYCTVDYVVKRLENQSNIE